MLVTNRSTQALARPAREIATKRHVLVPVEGGPVSQDVLSAVRALDPEHVTMLHVSSPRSLPDAGLGDVAERLNSTTRVTTLTREGRAAPTILEVAGDHGASLVAMATSARSRLGRWLRPSVTEAVIAGSPVPVLALPATRSSKGKGADRLFDRVLVPHDGSRSGSRPIEALALLVDPERVRLTIFGVIETFGPETPPFPAGRRENVAERILRKQAGELERKLERVAARARSLGFRADVLVDIGAPIGRVLHRARTVRATLLAIGDRERSRLSRMFLASTAQRILRVADVPVLVCP